MNTLPVPPQGAITSLQQALAQLVEHTSRRVKDGIRSSATLSMQRIHVRWIAERLGAELDIAALTPPALRTIAEQWHTSGGEGGRPLNLKTVAKRLSTLRRALRLAVERGELPALPQFPEIGLPPLRPRQRILTSVAELDRLLAALPPRRAEWVSLAVWTCQRPGDTERMSWCDVDLDGPTPSMRIRSTKTRRPDGIRVKVPRPLVSVLAERRTRLTEANGPPLPSDRLVEPWPGVSKMLPVVCVRVGLPPMSAMDLRHTGISWMVRRTGLTPAAQHWGGWSDFGMMQRYYAHALPAGLVEASDELASMATRQDAQEAPRRRRRRCAA